MNAKVSFAHSLSRALEAMSDCSSSDWALPCADATRQRNVNPIVAICFIVLLKTMFFVTERAHGSLLPVLSDVADILNLSMFGCLQPSFRKICTRTTVSRSPHREHGAPSQVLLDAVDTH